MQNILTHGTFAPINPLEESESEHKFDGFDFVCSLVTIKWNKSEPHRQGKYTKV